MGAIRLNLRADHGHCECVAGLRLESYQEVFLALTAEKCESRKQGGYAVSCVMMMTARLRPS
jgi:hypothetical protein